MTKLFENKVSDYISRHSLLHGNEPIVVAISGGADSVALLAVLCALRYDCIAAHCNFHLRGDESDRDMRHVQSIAEHLGVKLLVRHFDVPAQMQRTRQSVEMACRELRYDWFRELLNEHHAQAIAVGHHREDQVETFMLNLMRGTGIAGLTGMASSAADVVRPLLECSRADIEQYVADKRLSYIVDSTNAQNDYKRNRLRNVVIPTIEQNFDGATNAILTTMSHLAGNKALYTYAVQALGEQYHISDNALNINAMRKALPAPIARMLLFEMLRPMLFNITQVENILAANATATFTSPTHRAELSRGVLTIVINTDVNKADIARLAPDHEDSAHRVSLNDDITEPIHIIVCQQTIDQFRPTRNADTIYLDASVLHGNPVFELRHWRRGDTMQPFGMKGTKLVSNIFADLKFTATQKRDTWLLTRNGTILWIVGHRASAHFPVTTLPHLRLTVFQP